MISSLNTFRFLTALAIFGYHTLNSFLNYNHNIIIIDFGKGLAIFMTGFFVLSGFILCHVYHNYNFSNRQNLVIFYLKRLSRIYPVYAIATIIYFAFAIKIPGDKLFQIFITDFFMLQSFFEDTLSIGINNTTWSLSVEMFLYLLFPFILILTKNPKYLFIFSLIFSFIISYNFILDENRYVYANPLNRLADFTFGIGIYFFKEKIGKLKYRNLLHISSVLMIFIICLIVKEKHMALQFVVIALFGIWIACCYYSKSIFYNNKITNYLGKISYSFYLWQFISLAIGNIIKNSYENISFITLFIIILLTNILISSYSYYVIEFKSRNFFNKKINQFKFVK
jgi:peptidoglycan/LPS O-acetylase OafA/YrhL